MYTQYTYLHIDTDTHMHTYILRLHLKSVLLLRLKTGPLELRGGVGSEGAFGNGAVAGGGAVGSGGGEDDNDAVADAVVVCMNRDSS